MSGYQEISAYGDNGEGDSGDHWVVVCSGMIIFSLVCPNSIYRSI